MPDELDHLKDRIQQARDTSLPEKKSAPSDEAESTNNGIRAVTDLVVTPVVCGGIGMGLDHWFKTGPVFFIIMAALGVITGFWNLARMMKGADSSVGFKRTGQKDGDVE